MHREPALTTLLLQGYTGHMAQFPSTQWSLIRRSGETPSQRHIAFGQLALAYRNAILAFFRARLAATDAEDATQAFLTASYEHAWWARADAEIGSFRGFLLMLLHRHLGHLRGTRVEMTGACDVAPLLLDPLPSSDHQFDTRFALVLTGRALQVLRLHYRERGRGAMFKQLLPLLASPPEHGELKPIALSMQMPANTLTIELKRLRARLREQLRAELMNLCADEAAFASDWSALQRVLDGRD